MTTHPNVILMAVLTPDGLARKTMREIRAEQTRHYSNNTDFLIGKIEYSSLIMESSYNKDLQIGAKEGSLVFFDFVTYGYGETISWVTLAKQQEILEQWAQKTCVEHNCKYEIRVSANYW